MKLGYKIVFTNSNVKEGPVFNDDDALRKYAKDVRPFLRKVFLTQEELKQDAEKPEKPKIIFDDSSDIVYLLQFVGNEGYMLAVIKAHHQAEGKPYDNTAIWIHVPLNADIDKAKFHKTLNDLGNILSDPDNLNIAKLQKIANDELDESPCMVQPLTSKDEIGNVGVFLFGDDTNYQLEEILGPEIYQPGFAEFQALFLVNNKLGLALKNDVVAYVNVEDFVTVQHPQEWDGFKPYIGKQLFDRPLEIANGSHLTVTWKKDGYLDIPKEVTVSVGLNLNKYRPKEDEEFYIFYKKWYVVRADHSDRLLHKATVEINGQTFDSDTLLICQNSLKYGYDLKVNYPGYDEYFAVMPLKGRSLPMDIRLVQTVHTYDFTLTAYDDKGKRLDEEILAVLKTPKTITKSPINGYNLGKDDPILKAGGIYHLSYNPLKTKIIYGLIGAAVMGLLWLIVSLTDRPTRQVIINSPVPTTTVVEKPQATVVEQTPAVQEVKDSVEKVIESEKPTIQEKAEP